MKVCAMSDLHGYKVDIPKCDVLVVAGDISSSGDETWFKNDFIPYLSENKDKYDICFLVFGNHDDKIQMANITNVPNYIKILTNTEYKYKNKKFFGSPYSKYTPEIYKTMNTLIESSLKMLFECIPEDTDILITHSPPYGIGDVVVNETEHLGSVSLLERIKIVKPKIHIFGHIHTGEKYTKENGTKHYNVSILGENYKITNKPIIIDV